MLLVILLVALIPVASVAWPWVRSRLSDLQITADGVEIFNFPMRVRRIALEEIDRFDASSRSSHGSGVRMVATVLLLKDGRKVAVCAAGDAGDGPGVAVLNNRVTELQRVES